MADGRNPNAGPGEESHDGCLGESEGVQHTKAVQLVNEHCQARKRRLMTMALYTDGEQRKNHQQINPHLQSLYFCLCPPQAT